MSGFRIRIANPNKNKAQSQKNKIQPVESATNSVVKPITGFLPSSCLTIILSLDFITILKHKGGLELFKDIWLTPWLSKKNTFWVVKKYDKNYLFLSAWCFKTSKGNALAPKPRNLIKMQSTLNKGYNIKGLAVYNHTI